MEGASVRVVWRKNLVGVEGTLWILHSTQRMRISYEIELQFCRFFPCTAGKCYHQDAAGFPASARTCCSLETWSFHVSVLLNISPRCLCVLTWGMGTPFIRTSGLCFAVLPIARCLLLGALKSMPHLSAHEAAVSRSELRRAQLDMLDLSAVCNVVSSAKIEHWLWVDSGRSLIKIRKSTGPRTVPCGIPDFGVSGADVVPSKRTHCSLCVLIFWLTSVDSHFRTGALSFSFSC